jgi:hypothetical protein
MLSETFARAGLRIGGVRGVRIASYSALVVLAIVAYGIARRLSPDAKWLLFDLGVGFLFATLLDVLSRRMIAAEARGQRRMLAAIILGVSFAAAAQGVFAVTISGTPIGAAQLPGLVIVQLLGAVGGGALGFLTAFVAAALVLPARYLFRRKSAALDGLFIGAGSGLLGGWTVAEAPRLGTWFLLASTVVCGAAGYRATRIYARALEGPTCKLPQAA